jgi:hypothetical protein
MLYAIVRDTPSSWEDYRRLAAELGDELPAGLVLHVAGRTGEGVRVIEVWRSRSALELFERDRLRPAEQRSPAPLRDPVVRALVIEHVLCAAETQVLSRRAGQ